MVLQCPTLMFELVCHLLGISRQMFSLFLYQEESWMEKSILSVLPVCLIEGLGLFVRRFTKCLLDT